MIQKNIYYYSLLFIGLGFLSEIFSVSWAILPSRVLTVNHEHVKTGPVLFSSAEKNSKEISRVFHLYLKIANFNAVVNSSTIEHTLDKLNISGNSRITHSELKKISRHIDADRFLLSSVRKKGSLFEIESMVYYSHSEKLTDPIVTKHNNLWKLIGIHLKKRFPSVRFPEFADINSLQPVIFAIDASGGNFYEIKSLLNIMPKIEASTYAVCAVDGYGNLASFSPNFNRHEFYTFLKNMKIKGGSNYLENFEKVIHCASKYNSYSGDVKSKPVTVFLTGGLPKSEADRRYIKNLIRGISKKSDILILSSGKSSLEASDFWKTAVESATQRTKALYKDIVYTHEVGLKTGESWYVHKKAYQIYELKTKDISETDKGIKVPAHRQSEFTPSNLLKLYKEFSGNTVISSSKLVVNIEDLILSFLQKPQNISSENKNLKSASLLIEINKIPFWIYLPYDSVYSSSGEILINKDETYYFLLNLKKGEKGMPISNFKNFGIILKNNREVSESLLLDIDDYLSNGEKYLNHSLNGSSIYILRGKVKLIRFSERDIFE